MPLLIQSFMYLLSLHTCRFSDFARVARSWLGSFSSYERTLMNVGIYGLLSCYLSAITENRHGLRFCLLLYKKNPYKYMSRYYEKSPLHASVLLFRIRGMFVPLMMHHPPLICGSKQHRNMNIEKPVACDAFPLI